MASSSSNNSHVSYSSFSDSFLKANPEMVKELGASEVKKLAGAFFQPSLNGSLDNSESLFSSLKSDILSRLFLELEKAGKSLTKKNQASTRKEYIAKVEGLRNTLDGSEKDYKRYIKEIFDLSISLHCTWPDDPELWKPVFLEEAYEEYSKGGLKLCFLDDLEYLFSFISCVGKIKCVAQVKKIELPAVVSKLEKFIEDSLIRNLNTLSSSQCAAYLGAVNRHLKMAKSTPPYAKLLVAQLSQIAQDKRFPKGQHPLFRNKFPVTVAALILLRKGLSCNEKVLKQFVELAKRMPERSERGSDHTAKTKKQVQLFASNPSKGQLPEQVWPLVREEGIQDWNFGHLRLAWELSHKKMSTAAPQNLQSYLHLACEILSDPRLGRGRQAFEESVTSFLGMIPPASVEKLKVDEFYSELSKIQMHRFFRLAQNAPRFLKRLKESTAKLGAEGSGNLWLLSKQTEFSGQLLNGYWDKCRALHKQTDALFEKRKEQQLKRLLEIVQAEADRWRSEQVTTEAFGSLSESLKESVKKLQLSDQSLEKWEKVYETHGDFFMAEISKLQTAFKALQEGSCRELSQLEISKQKLESRHTQFEKALNGLVDQESLKELERKTQRQLMDLARAVASRKIEKQVSDSQTAVTERVFELRLPLDRDLKSLKELEAEHQSKCQEILRQAELKISAAKNSTQMHATCNEMGLEILSRTATSKRKLSARLTPSVVPKKRADTSKLQIQLLAQKTEIAKLKLKLNSKKEALRRLNEDFNDAKKVSSSSSNSSSSQSAPVERLRRRSGTWQGEKLLKHMEQVDVLVTLGGKKAQPIMDKFGIKSWGAAKRGIPKYMKERGKREKLARILCAVGFSEKHKKGSHSKYKHPKLSSAHLELCSHQAAGGEEDPQSSKKVCLELIRLMKLLKKELYAGLQH